MDDIVTRLRDPDYAGALQHLRSWDEIDRLFNAAADRIETHQSDADAHIARLERLRRQEDEIRDLKAERDALRSDISRLTKALEPFAKFKTADGLPCGFLRIPDEHPMIFNGLGDDIEFVITVGDFRRAAALRQKSDVPTDVNDMPEGEKP